MFSWRSAMAGTAAVVVAGTGAYCVALYRAGGRDAVAKPSSEGDSDSAEVQRNEHGWRAKLSNPGNLLIGIAALHTSILFVIPELSAPYLAALRSGFNGVVVDGQPALDRSHSNFFALSGAMMFACGLTMRCYIRDAKKPVPKSIGWSLVATGLGFSVLDVKSGGWLILAVGAHIVYSATGHDVKPRLKDHNL
mmetsp:Transcript_40339/g.40978  ORF Transcript_40339/g.40978 Transcript_40339/m.40978 type:complete len:193 (-) Transcript_40339:283-861(-)